MERKDDLWKNELLTQSEVADYFKVSDNTVKNWRGRGLFSFFKAPGSSRILYYRKEVEDFQKKFTTWRKETENKQKRTLRAKPRLSSNDDWRIS